MTGADRASLVAEHVGAEIVEEEVCAQIALEIPGLAGRLGDEPAVIIGVQSRRRPALLEIVESRPGIERFGRQKPERLEDAPFGLHAEPRIASAAKLEIPQR